MISLSKNFVLQYTKVEAGLDAYLNFLNLGESLNDEFNDGHFFIKVNPENKA